jgi:hypothetical protein
MNKTITISLSYYNQDKKTLVRHIESWKEFPVEIREKFSFFIIDDCSKIPAHDLLKDIDVKGLDLHMYRVKEDLYCNIAGVRNLGAKECKTPYMMIIDMDTVVSPVMSHELVELAKNNINNNIAFRFNRKGGKKSGHMHPAVCLIRKKDYWDIGGCEEDLVGHYGWTDPSFWHRARGKVKEQECKNIYLNYHSDGEADIKRDHGHNKGVFKHKMRTNSWSKDYVRFKWEKIL